MGLNGSSKCTWALVGKDKTAAPSLKFTQADYSNFLFGWIEYAVDAELVAGGFMPAADASPFHLGNYVATDGPFMNPARSTSGDASPVSWAVATAVYDETDKTQQGNLNGSFG
jgi:hypothetical protein